MAKELDNPRKRLINIQNTDIECFTQSGVRYLNPADRNSTMITKADKHFEFHWH